MTLVQKEVKKVRKGTTLVRPTSGTYSPTTDTLAYYPLINNATDVMGNTTLGGTKSQSTLGYTFTTQGGVELVS